MFLGAASAFATDNTDVVDEINITVPVSCTLTGTNLLHTDTIQNNQYKTDIGSATIKATCNDTNGLAIYAIGYTNETDGNNKMHSSTLGSTYDIVTGKYVSGTTTNSVWSMKLTPVSGTYAPTIRNDSSYNYTNYELIPSTYTKVAYRTTATDTGTGSTGANFTTDYAVYASATQPAGTYTGKVKFTLVHPQNEVPVQPVACEGGKICYNPNSNLVEGSMGKVAGTAGDSVRLLASNYSRNGYGFAGWNTEPDYSGSFYGPSESITLPQSITTDGLSLYAVWVESEGALQDANKVSSLCNSANGLKQAPIDGSADLSSVAALTDLRDNQTYAIAKLADGNCWMIENMRLDSQYTTGSNASLAQGYGGVFIGLAEAEPSFDNDNNPNSLYTTQSYPIEGHQIIIGDYPVIPRYSNISTTSRATNLTSNEEQAFSYGYYYTWTAAIANTSDLYKGNHTTTSICPLNWQLPVGILSNFEQNIDKGFSTLRIALGGDANSSGDSGEVAIRFNQFPNNFIFEGFWSSSLYNRGKDSMLWSATANSLYGANHLRLYRSNYVETTDTAYDNKNYGLPIRCILSLNNN